MERKSKTSTERADAWLKRRFPMLSNRQIEEAMDRELVLDAAGKKVQKGLRAESHELQTSGLTAHLETLKRGNGELDVRIVYEEDGFVIVDKPPGVASHPLSLFDSGTLTQWAFAHYPEIAGEFDEAQPTLVPHRLDGGTSGIIVVAKTRIAFNQWRDKFAKKRVAKKYLAWCWGTPSRSKIEINLALAHDLADRRKMAAPSLGERYSAPVLEAQSLVTVKRQEDGFFLAEVECFTGVTHQVRVHLAKTGHPLVGDSLYDSQPRTARPEFHQLRATELYVDGSGFKVSTTDFEEAYRYWTNSSNV